MCGIAGLAKAQGSVDERVLAEMAAALTHRGPDSHGTWVDAGIGLTHRRLAIVDLSAAGHQPMQSADGAWVLSYNGEIYNASDLSRELNIPLRGHSDTEVLIEAISRWGVVETAERLIGMFAFAAWHKPSGTLYLCRDRLGIKPLYFGWLKQDFVFASELHALRGWRDELQIDHNALASYACYGNIPYPQSIYAGIEKLPPGVVLSLNPAAGPDAELQQHRYWDPAAVAAQPQLDVSAPEALDMLQATLRDAVACRLVADVPLGGFLSGGFDSSLVCALMQEQADAPINTYTIGFRDPAYNEAEHAARVAEHLGTHHTELYVDESDLLATVDALPALLDEPFADSSLLPTFLVCKLARQHVTVTLSGDGGDELFWGYNRYPLFMSMWRRLRWVPGWARSSFKSIAQHGWVQAATRRIPAPAWGGREGPLSQKLFSAGEIFGHRDQRALYDSLMTTWRDPDALLLRGKAPPSSYNDASHWTQQHQDYARLAWQDTVNYLPNDILTKVDRASMAVSLEARVPLLDHRVVELAARMPGTLKYHDGRSKIALREILARYVPPEITDRPKMGFGVPLHSWLRGPLRAWAQDLLSPTQLEREGLFNTGCVQQLLTDHLAGRANNADRLWNVLMVQTWLHNR